MSEYVGKAAIVAEIRERARGVFPLPSFPYEQGLQNGLLEAAAMVESAPAADVVPACFGTWNKIKIPPAGYNLYGWQCSECGYVDEAPHSATETAFPYCPHCGAKMDA